MKYSNRGQCSCIFKTSRGQKGIKMQKITHKYKVLKKQHSIIFVNPVTIENYPFADIQNWHREVVFVER